MVFIAHSKHYYGSKVIFNKPNSFFSDSSDQSQLQPIDPAMTNIQKDATVKDLEGEYANDIGDLGNLTGQGFKVHGGRLKHTHPKNEKLRKFVSLNLK